MNIWKRNVLHFAELHFFLKEKKTYLYQIIYPADDDIDEIIIKSEMDDKLEKKTCHKYILQRSLDG